MRNGIGFLVLVVVFTALSTIAAAAGESRPEVYSIQPPYALPGQRITIRGANFLDVPSGTGGSQLQVWFTNDQGGTNWLDAYGVISWENETIMLNIPPSLIPGEAYQVVVLRVDKASPQFWYPLGLVHWLYLPAIVR